MYRDAMQAALPSVVPYLVSVDGALLLATGCLQLARVSTKAGRRCSLTSENWSLQNHFTNSSHSTSVLQVAVNLAVAEEELQFEHRDLHHGNVLLKLTAEDSLAFKFRCGSFVCTMWPLMKALPFTVLQSCLVSLRQPWQSGLPFLSYSALGAILEEPAR